MRLSLQDITTKSARLAAVFSVAGAALLGTTALAEAKRLALSSWLPPAHPLVAKVIKPWGEEVGRVTGGRVTVRVLPAPLGPPPGHYDLAADGVADITYGLHSFTTDDRFLRSRIGQFSFLGNTAEETSVAYWKVYSGALKAQQEHAGVKLLGLWTHGPGMFHNAKRRIEKADDFDGLKIRVPGGYIADLVKALGSTTQFMGPGEVFEKLSTGVIDGVIFPAEALKSFNLSKHVKYSTTFPGGLYNTSWFLVMNKADWDAISQEDQAKIEAISGAHLAATAGKVWDEADKAGLADAAAHKVDVYRAPEAVIARTKQIADQKEAEWAKAVAKQGFDGAAALKAMRAETKQ